MKPHIVAALLSFVTMTTLIVVLACGGSTVGKTDAPPAAGAGGGASGGAQCGKDSDCKGDRVCDHGQCVSPR